jgi:hypothetical protein
MADRDDRSAASSSVGKRTHHRYYDKSRSPRARSESFQETHRKHEKARRQEHKQQDELRDETIRTLQETLARKTRRIRHLEEEIKLLQQSAWDQDRSGGFWDNNEDDADEDPDEGTWSPDDCFATVNRIKANEALCRRGIRHSPEEFDELCADARPFFERTTSKGEPRQRRSRKVPRLPFEVQLFLYLWFCVSYPAIWMLSFTFSVPMRYCHKVLKRSSVALRDFAIAAPYAAGGMCWPTTEQLEEILEKQAGMVNRGLEDIAFALDGFHLGVWAPAAQSDLKRRLWQTYERKFAVTFLFVCTLQGRIVQALGPYAQPDEQRIFKGTLIHEKLFDLGAGVCHDAKIIADIKSSEVGERIKAAWTMGPGTLKTCKELKPELEHTTAGQVIAAALHNTKLVSQMRIVVEDLMAQLRYWKILRGPFRTYHSGEHASVYGLFLDDVARGLAHLTNRRILKNPLRADDWTPGERQKPDSEAFAPLVHPTTGTEFANVNVFEHFVAKAKGIYESMAQEPRGPAWNTKFDHEMQSQLTHGFTPIGRIVFWHSQQRQWTYVLPPAFGSQVLRQRIVRAWVDLPHQAQQVGYNDVDMGLD